VKVKYRALDESERKARRTGHADDLAGDKEDEAEGLEYRTKRETEILKRETPVRMLLNVSIPHESFNTAVHSDIAGTTMARFISYTSRTRC
jgi:hypothetical protein